MKGFGSALSKQTAGASSAAGQAGGMAFGKAMLAGIAVVATGAVVAGAALFKIGETFDEVSDTIRVGTGATGKDLDGLKADFRAVVSDVPADFGDASNAIADLNTRTGQTGEPLQLLAKQVLEMTRLTGGDLKTNIAATTRVFGDWGVATGDQSETMDYLFKVSQSTGIGIDGLSQKVVQFGAPLRQLGFDFETSAAMLGKWEKEGVNTEAILGGMKIGLGKLSKAGVEPVEALKKIQEAIAGAGSAGEANKIAIETFGQRAGPDMAAAIREGRFDLDELMGSLKGSKETILGAASDTNDFAESWILFKNKAMLVVEPIATRVFGMVSQFMKWVTDVGAPAVQAFAAAWVMPALQEVGSYIAGTIVPALQAMVEWIKQNEGWLIPLAAGIGAVVIAMQIYSGIIAVVQVATGAWAAITGVLNVVMAANPIGLLILAIVGVVAAITVAYFKFEGFRNIIDSVWQGIQTVVAVVVDFFQTRVMPVLQFVFAAITIYVQTALAIYTTAWNAIYAAVEFVVAFFQTRVMPVLKFVFNAISTYVKAVLTVYTTVWTGIRAVVQTVVSWFSETVWPAIKTAIDSIVAGFVVFKDNVQAKWDAFLAIFTGIAATFLSIGGDIVNGIRDGFSNAWNGFMNWVREKIDSLPWAVKKVLGIASPSKVFAGIGGNIVDGLEKGMSDRFPNVEKQMASSIEGLANLGSVSAGSLVMAGKIIPNGSLDMAPPAMRKAAVAGAGGGATSADIAALGDRFAAELARQARLIQQLQRQG